MRDYLLPALRLIPGVAITHICSKDGRTASELARRWCIPNQAATWEEMLYGADRPEAVVVAADPCVHAIVAFAALSQGVHTYVEKPPATDVETIRRLSRLERSRPETATYVGYNFEQAAQYVAGMSILRSRTEPSLMELRLVSSGPCDRGCYETVLRRVIWDTLIHPVHMAVMALGQPISLKVALVKLDGPLLAVRVLIEHAEGKQSIIEVGNYADRFDFHIRVVGSTGLSIEVDSLKVLRLHGHTGSVINEKETIESSWPARRLNANCIGYVPSLEKFVENIGMRKASSSSFSDSVETVVALERISAQVTSLYTEYEAPFI
jgi:predicted dehydrogenase